MYLSNEIGEKIREGRNKRRRNKSDNKTGSKKGDNQLIQQLNDGILSFEELIVRFT
jgi:hypothetical protein